MDRSAIEHKAKLKGGTDPKDQVANAGEQKGIGLDREAGRGAVSRPTADSQAERRDQLIKAQDKAVQEGQSGKWKQGVGGNDTTHCNQATRYVLEQMGVNTKGLTTANEMARIFDREAGKPNGSWIRVDKPETAQMLANQGIPVVAAREGKNHGHVATVRPGHEPTGGAPFLANVGVYNKTKTDLPANQSHNDFRYYVPGAFREHIKEGAGVSR